MLPIVLSQMAVLAPRPNLIMVVSDDHGWHNIQLRNINMSTPHMDEMITKEGVLFDRHCEIVIACSACATAVLYNIDCGVCMQMFSRCAHQVALLSCLEDCQFMLTKKTVLLNSRGLA